MTSEETDVGDPTPINPNWREKAGSLSKKEEIKKRPSLVSTSISATRRVSLEEEEETYVIIKDASAKYGDTVCLSNINLDLEVAKLTAVIGQVGAGKTCLLNLILGELLPFEGTVRVKGVVAYAAQEPWLFAGMYAPCITSLKRRHLNYSSNYRHSQHNLTLVRYKALN